MSGFRVAIVGDGKMGRAVADLARERGCTVTAMLGFRENEHGGALTRDRLGDTDVVIEFTEPAAAPANILAAVRAGYPVVTGTTGWADQLERVTKAVDDAQGALVHAPNFSVGVNLFLALAAAAGRVMRRTPQFDAHIVETHHAAKKDAPSGTGIALERAASSALARPILPSPTIAIRRPLTGRPGKMTSAVVAWLRAPDRRPRAT